MTMKKDDESRAQQVEPGHLPVSEWAGLYAGSQPPFGDDASHVPMRVDQLEWEYQPPQPPRYIEEEHQVAESEYLDRQDEQ